MAIISNFELLLKPLAPTGGPASEIARTIVQGYFLTISNLESRDIVLIFRTKTAVKGPNDSVNTEFTAPVNGVANNVVALDTTEDNNFLVSQNMLSGGELIQGKQRGDYLPCLLLPAGQTGTFALLPNVQTLLPSPGSPSPDLAIRGYTELVIGSLDGAPESARVLVSPEHRGTFVDQDFDPGNFAVQSDLDFDQLAYSLPTANGQALQNINTYATFADPFEDRLTSNFFLPNARAAISSMVEFGKKLSQGPDISERTAAFTIGNVPFKFNYAVRKGKLNIDEKGLEKSLRILAKKNNASKRMPSASDLMRMIHGALEGNKKADRALQRTFKRMMQ